MSEPSRDQAGDGAPAETRKKILIVADRSAECRLALRFAGRRAWHTGGRLALLYVIEPADFQHWMSVEEVMRAEALAEAEGVLHALASEINKATGIIVEYIIREGRKPEELLRHVKEDPSIRLLVLGASKEREGPGPLVAALASGFSASFPIPVTIVPGSMTDAEIDELA